MLDSFKEIAEIFKSNEKQIEQFKRTIDETNDLLDQALEINEEELELSDKLTDDKNLNESEVEVSTSEDYLINLSNTNNNSTESNQDKIMSNQILNNITENKNQSNSRIDTTGTTKSGEAIMCFDGVELRKWFNYFEEVTQNEISDRNKLILKMIATTKYKNIYIEERSSVDIKTILI